MSIFNPEKRNRPIRISNQLPFFSSPVHHRLTYTGSTTTPRSIYFENNLEKGENDGYQQLSTF